MSKFHTLRQSYHLCVCQYSLTPHSALHSDAERAGLEYIYDLRNKFESGEVPFRQPRAKGKEPAEEEGQGLAGLWSAITGGK